MIDGAQKIIAFSDHAILRICERVHARWWAYGGLGDVFALFDRLQHHDLTHLPDGQLAFVLWDNCSDRRFWNHRYVTEVAGIKEEEIDPRHGPHYFRVGYCPAVVEGPFLKALTLLSPGYSKTPEYAAVLTSKMAPALKTSILTRATMLDAASLMRSNDWEPLRIFHKLGVPQVIQSKLNYLRC